MKRKPFSHRRRAPTRDPKRVFYIFCEGKNTEPEYFAALRRATKDAQIELQTFDGAGVPITLAKAASAHLKSVQRRSRNSFEKKDEVWAVFDRDDHPSYADAKAHCKETGVGIANSNPCFEIWLILHIKEFHAPIGRDDVCKVLSKISDYNLQTKKMNFDELISSIRSAEKNAEKQLVERRKEAAGEAMGPPYTLVFHLTRAIEEAVRLSRR